MSNSGANSDEDNQCSGLIVISVPGWCDQSSERSDAGFCILLKVIAIVKLVVVGAVGKWKSLLRFPRALFARLFHSFWPADSFTFPPSLLSFYAWSLRASRCDARCAPAGRGFRRPVWDLRSV